MPVKRHWFHVSHDINSDGEVWELTDKFGVSGLRVWLELLAIADRNDGGVLIDSEASLRQLSIKCNTTQRHLRGILEFIQSRLWVVSDPSPRIRNWSIYNPFREHKGSPTAAPPNHPNHPTQPNKKKYKNTSSRPPPLEAQQCAELLSEKISQNYPERTETSQSQLKSWAIEAERIERLDHHSYGSIRELIDWAAKDSFWRANILSMGKVREKWNQLQAKKQQQGNGGPGLSRIEQAQEAMARRNQEMLTRGLK